MPYKPLAIANYFIDRAHMDGQTIDQMKLQKLVYLAHGWHLAIYGEPLIAEKVEAWQYGPVIPSLWREFTRYGSGPILENGTETQFGKISVPSVPPEDKQTLALLRTVWQVYSEYSGIQLSKMTHEQNSPWDKSYRRGRRPRLKMDDGQIREHFKSELAVAEAGA